MYNKESVDTTIKILEIACQAREEAVYKGDWMAVIRLGGLISLIRKDMIADLEQKLAMALKGAA